MLYNPFKQLSTKDWILYLVSLAVVIPSNFFGGSPDPINLVATAVGITGLIFVARGDVWGQVLFVLFAVLYAITSFRFAYYGEMITYLFMSGPISFMSVITWIKNPFQGGNHEVKIRKMTKKHTVFMFLLSLVVTVIFYFILKTFHTANLIVSTISITTSFLAAYLMLFRNPYYAIAYAGNDIVLIILWLLASIKDISYFPMVLCFIMFLVNDIYGFVCWRSREARQKADALNS
jgi:nicotinamide mononucleotide transporter PnuC